MIFRPLELVGAFIIEISPLCDERGFFARSFCTEDFERHGLDPAVSQCNISFNRHAGTVRGLHYQAAPNAESKLVRCTRGRLYDVIVDLRRGSSSYGRWVGVELSADNRTALYVPRGFAHGFQTLADDTEVFYQMSAAYVAGAARGVRWNDPELAITWPVADARCLSGRDAALPYLAEVTPEPRQDEPK